jgi:sensor histidine kinase YesM
MTERIDLTAAPPRKRWVAAWVGGWAAYIVLDALIVTAQSNVRFAHSLTEAVAGHLPFAFASILVWQVSARRWKSRAAFIVTQIVLGVAVVAIAKTIEFLYIWAAVPPAVWHMIFDKSWMYQLVTAALEYSTLLGIILALQARRRERDAEALIRDAEVAAARAQLHPHFILNSLNSIVSLIDTDPPRAREMVVQLSHLLQSSFRGLDEEMVPLDREIDMARAYLGIEQVRFGARLEVKIEVAENARAIEVPPLVLQPIVENAVRHGVAPHPRAGEVRITGTLRGDRLLLEVHDSGDGADDDALREGGRGLQLTRRRLDHVYGADYALSFDRSGGGFTVRLDLPERHG